MPVEVKALACKFRCGFTRIGMKRGIVEEHEGRCRENPKSRTCVTCKHDEKVFVETAREGNVVQGDYVNHCEHFPQSLDPNDSQLMTRDCKQWKLNLKRLINRPKVMR